MPPEKVVDKKGNVRINAFVPLGLYTEYKKLQPHYGQLSALVRTAMLKVVADTDRDLARLFDDEPHIGSVSSTHNPEVSE